MKIQHNMSAMNTQRTMSIVGEKIAENIKKLSSGYCINKASDDAAGLTISEKMLTQIRGLNKASTNIQDAISFCQVADGAMGELHDMVGRMRELSVQAANGTYTDSDRENIQHEINGLLDGMRRIFKDTEFNTLPVFYGELVSKETEGTSDITSGGTDSYYTDLRLILGDEHITNSHKVDDPITFSGTGWTSTGKLYYQAECHDYGPITLDWLKNYLTGYNIDNHDLNSFSVSTGTYSVNGNQIIYQNNLLMKKITLNYGWDLNGNSILKNLEIKTASNSIEERIYTVGLEGAIGILDNTYGSAWLDFSEFGTKYTLEDLYEEGFNCTCATCSRHYSIKFINGGGNTTNADGVSYNYVNSINMPALEIDIRGVKSGAELVARIISAVNSATNYNDHFTQFAVNSDNPAKLCIYDNRTYAVTGGTSIFETFPRNVDGTPGTKSQPSSYVTTEISRLWIQLGSNALEGVWLERPILNTKLLGIDNLSVLTQEAADQSISIIDNAVQILSAKRSMVGAQQNRLEHSAANVDTMLESIENADSRIKDTNMAKEMIALIKNNILMDSSQLMLTHANQRSQNILYLLR